MTHGCVVRMLAWPSRDLDSIPSSAVDFLCDFGQIVSFLCSPSAKIILCLAHLFSAVSSLEQATPLTMHVYSAERSDALISTGASRRYRNKSYCKQITGCKGAVSLLQG